MPTQHIKSCIVTASLDLEVEALVQEAISHVTKGRTTITIAHRLTTIVKSDVIMILQNGRIVESGSHIELMRKKSYYRFLVEHLTSGLVTK